MSECEGADKNPLCPYISDIRHMQKDIAQIKIALVGENMQGGLVAEIQKLKRRWNARDIGTLFVGVGAVISAVVALLK